jgi:ABC-type glycerol-3-phosphate transport system substrate-binding protein
MRKALARFRQISEHVDPSSPNRQWNETTNLVITGKALMQIHGDWMKGEFKAAGKKLGVDFECTNIPGTKALVVTSDAFGFLKTSKPDMTKGEMDFALDAVDPIITAEFNAHKGATPVRNDVDPAALDKCNKLVLDTLKDRTGKSPTRSTPRTRIGIARSGTKPTSSGTTRSRRRTISSRRCNRRTTKCTDEAVGRDWLRLRRSGVQRLRLGRP